ncbi:3'-phosphoadenosine 5'-phosphosulfate sulfotransferase [Knufia obscura]|uniref:FAD synthase n=2 Tax=Knufia TaxID=430999 RepID=A0AAN8IPY1_9EURO|nr:3'-phosphoadenosine 5'-phosphosulfate sulfotransferase [Knufia obscura]KAK5955492.1 3'-phosphoadenosine 5'-phosphosulfate sulfotransferase [Knufia fluminis]
MSSDASAAAASPMTNGSVPSGTGSHREADASNNPATASSTQHLQSLADVCADLNQRVTSFLTASPESEVVKRTQEQTRISIKVIEKALEDYDFNALSLSYNGGKDCLVLLILYLSTLHTHFTSQSAPTSHDATASVSSHPLSTTDTTISKFPTSIPSIYAKPPDPFPAVTSFVDSSSTQYHLSLTHIQTNPGTKPTTAKANSHSSPPTSPEKQRTQAFETETTQKDPSEAGRTITFRDAFAIYLHSHPSVRAIFVGTRRTDPHGSSLTHFDRTDGNWPDFMRIHPVIDWHLSEIWCFLRSPHLAPPNAENEDGEEKHLDYCTMYDEGYTSLGGVNDTLRNPHLKYTDETGQERYKPAYTLTEDDEERLGRE